MSQKILNSFIIVSLVCSLVTPIPKAHAESLLGLPEPGTMVNLSPAYEPMLIKGLKVHPENPFLFDFIIDTGTLATQEPLKPEISKLIKYFLAAVTIPEKDLWVNLSPYEKDRMIASNLAQTEMGRDMLAQDYILKQLTASLIYPEKDLGKTFWDEVYTKAQQLYGVTQIPVDTFNKVWIVADKADVYEHDNVAYVVGAHLKVMLEEDYLAMTKHNVIKSAKAHSIASQVVREVILPEIENEVNTAKNFALLRQMFYSMILASWYKEALKNAILSQVYGNKSKVKVGINQPNPKMNEAIFSRYLRAYKKGVFNYIREDIDKSNGETIPRKYFWGGTDIWEDLPGAHILQYFDTAMLDKSKNVIDAQVDTFPVKHRSSVMKSQAISPQGKSGREYFKDAFPAMKRLPGKRGERGMNIREKGIPGNRVREFFDMVDTGVFTETPPDALGRELDEELWGKSKARLLERSPESMRGKRRNTLVVGMNYRLAGNDKNIARASYIVEVPLTPKEQLQAFLRIMGKNGTTSVVALEEETMLLAKNREVSITFNDKLKGLFNKKLLGTTATLTRNVVELFNPISIDVFDKIVSRLPDSQPKVGAFAKMVIEFAGRRYYLLELDDKNEIRPPGGGIKYRKKVKLKTLEESAATPPGATTAVVNETDSKKVELPGLVRSSESLAQGRATPAMETVPGGIDFNAGRMQKNFENEDQQPVINIDRAMIKRIRTNGFDGLEFSIDSIQITTLPLILGFGPKGQEQQLAAVSTPYAFEHHQFLN